MERRTSLIMCIYGRQPHGATAQRNYASCSQPGHAAGMVCQTAASWSGLSLPASRSQLAGEAGSRFREEKKNSFRSRMFLAFPWVPVWAGTEVETGLLASEARSQQTARQGESVSTSIAGLVGDHCLAMRNPLSRAPDAKTPAISGREKRLKERHG